MKFGIPNRSGPVGFEFVRAVVLAGGVPKGVPKDVPKGVPKGGILFGAVR